MNVTEKQEELSNLNKIVFFSERRLNSNTAIYLDDVERS